MRRALFLLLLFWPQTAWSGDPVGCEQSSHVIGRQDAGCHPFGQWGLLVRLPRMQVQMGSTLHLFPMGPVVFKDADYHGAELAPRREAGFTFDLGMNAIFARAFYLGAEGSIGGVALGGPRRVADQELTVDPDMGVLLQGGGVGGVLLRGGNVVARAEALVGGRAVLVSMSSTGANGISHGTGSTGAVVVMPRVALEVWLSPWLTVGAGAGKNLVIKDDFQISLYLNIHMRAHDGRFDAGQAEEVGKDTWAGR